MMYHHNPTCRKFKEIKRKRSALNSWRGRANLVFFAFFSPLREIISPTAALGKEKADRGPPT
jgi:hypothetical protein